MPVIVPASSAGGNFLLFLLDTDTLSQLVKKRPSVRLLERLRQEPADSLCTASVCVMELRYGTGLRADAESFWQRIHREILSRVRVFGLGTQEALVAGDLLVELTRKGRRIAVEDLLIAATAVANGCTLVTGNVRHFARIASLRVENWIELH